MPLLGMAQYPTTDDFTSIGGSGEWYNASGQSDMGIKDGTELSYNLTTGYNNNDLYIWRSPDYGTQFNDDGCDSISVTFEVDIFKKSQDILRFSYYDGGWTNITVSTSGTYSYDVPASTEYFAFNFTTGAGAGTNGKYVLIDYFTIGCYMTPLPIELIDFDCEWETNKVKIFWVSASEINNDYYLLEHSIDGFIWNNVDVIEGAGNSVEMLEYVTYHYGAMKGDNYYKLTQVDFDGSSETFSTIGCPNHVEMREPQKVTYMNYMGQEIKALQSGLYIRHTIYTNGDIEVTQVYLQINP